MTSSTSIEEIKAKFPHKNIDPILGEPTYATIHLLRRSLYANAASVATTSGGGQLGNLGLVMPPAKYNHKSLIPYVPPVDPGLTPVYPGGNITIAHRQTVIDDHKKLCTIFDLHNNVDAALKVQIIEAVEPMYLEEKMDQDTGFIAVNAQDLLAHLLNRYGGYHSGRLRG